MASKLVLRNTQKAKPNVDLGVIGTDDVYDMLKDSFGASLDTAVVNTAASGTEIIFTKTAGGSTICWISGRVPAGGFTLTTTDIDGWLRESNMNANCGGRFRVFKYTPGAPATLTELGGGPFNDGVEFGTASASMTWAGNVTDQAFAENDRIVLKLYITNVGTMASGHTCTLDFNAADASTGDSFFNIAETVTFKADDILESNSDTIGLTEAEIELVKKPRAETVSLTEQFSAIRVILEAASDTVSFVEGFAKQVNNAIGETVALTETFVKQVNNALAETVALTEARALRTFKTLGDTLGVTEALRKFITKTRGETVVLTEQLGTVTIPGGGGGALPIRYPPRTKAWRTQWMLMNGLDEPF